VVDESALAFSTVLVSGGRRGLDIELAPADLIRLTKATTAPIGTGDKHHS
jgi:Cys-tRNA(Pro)/Cys-tRNA(Cys) deacylase